MRYDPDLHHRRSVRLKGYDSQPGAYFVTVCTRDRECTLGDVIEDEVRVTELGHIVEECWHDLPSHYAHLRLDAFVIMPNHVHAIIILKGYPDVGAGLRPAPTAKRAGLPEIVRAFKAFSARRINELLDSAGTPFWQRNYYDHVIRNERELNAIRQYIADNPARWNDDPEHPGRNRRRRKSKQQGLV